MKPCSITALLCWYAEPAEWLMATVSSVARCCDHIVACDGAYALFPDAFEHPTSGPEQVAAIMLAAHASGIGCTIHVPSEPWQGGEVEKRSKLFELGLQVAEPMTGWLFVLDADEVISHVPADLHERLAATDKHVAGVTHWQRNSRHPVPTQDAEVPVWNPRPSVESNVWHRALFRAIPGLHVEGAHSVNVADLDGRKVYLRGRHDLHDLEPIEDIPELMVEHRHDWRPTGRAQAARDYCQLRDAVGVERLVTLHTTGLDGEPVPV